MSNQAGKAAVFIDGGYARKVFKKLNIMQVSYGALVKEIVSGFSLLRSYYYDCPPYQSSPPTRDESQRFAKTQRFYTALKKYGYFEVRLGYLIFRGYDQQGTPIFEQKGADVLLVVDLIQLTHQKMIDKAFIITGDGDFVPAIQFVKNFGVQVHLYYSDVSKYSQNLWDVCDARSLITPNLLSRCLLP
ncbi:MAG: NYN domain-containing protein [Desulforudis sp.]|jgi:uncharacterized LabA/DUF88 family protein|nr:MAG: NYN domain-containing protein [Desulforudis sp.]